MRKGSQQVTKSACKVGESGPIWAHFGPSGHTFEVLGHFWRSLAPFCGLLRAFSVFLCEIWNFSAIF